MTTQSTVAVAPMGSDDLPAAANHNALAWYVRHQDQCRLIVERYLGQTWTTLPEMADWLEAHIPSAEHGQELNAWMQERLTDELKDLLSHALTDVGMYRGSSIKNGKKNQVDYTGAKYHSMVTRICETIPRIISGGITVEQAMCSVGRRPRTDDQDGTIDTIIALIPDEVKTIPWVAAQIARKEPMAPEGMDPKKKGMFPKWGGPFESESALCQLAVLIALSRLIDVTQLEFNFMPLRSDDTSDDDVMQALRQKFEDTYGIDGTNDSGLGINEYIASLQYLRRTYMACTFMLPNGIEVVVLNAPVTMRSKGEPRPTTASTLKYKLRFFPPKYRATIIAVSGPFHGERVVGTYETNMHAERPDVSVYGFWLGAPEGSRIAGFNNALSEFVHLINAAAREYKKL